RVQDISWIVGAFKSEHYDYDLLPSNTRDSLLSKGLVTSYKATRTVNGDKRDILALRLTYAGQLLAALLSEAGMLSISLDDVLERDRWIDESTKVYQPEETEVA